MPPKAHYKYPNCSFNNCKKAVEKIGFWPGGIKAFLLILPN